MRPLEVLLFYNQPVLSPDDPDWAAEAGVLEAVEAVERAVVTRGHRVRRLGVARSAEEVLRQLLDQPRPDVTFNLCEGLNGVGQGESQLTGLLELLGYPLTGSGSECLALVRDKARTKWLLKGAGLPTADFESLLPGEPAAEQRFRPLLDQGPVIVKPLSEDASMGIGPDSVVGDWPSLARQIQTVRERYGPVLVERFIAGREFNAAAIALGEPELLPLAEIEFAAHLPPNQRIVTYEAKWSSGSAADQATVPRCPAEVEPELAREIGRVALSAFSVAGCRDYARIDLRVDPQGNVYVLEVNGNPDLSPSAGLARAVQYSGRKYEDFLAELVAYVARARKPAS